VEASVSFALPDALLVRRMAARCRFRELDSMNGFAKTQSPAVDAPAAPAPLPTSDLSLHLLFHLAAGAALLAAVLSLTACGGGGASAPEPPPPPPPPPAPAPTAPIAAQRSVPIPVGYDADRLAAFNRLNELRVAAGLGMLAQSTAMDQAAQAHAAWMIANDSFTHEEIAGTPGFTGLNWPRRDEAFGYVPVQGIEVMAAPAHGAQGVDALINMPYHRAGMLAFEPVDVGVGWTDGAALNLSIPLVMDITRPGTDVVRGLGQDAQVGIHGVELWPVDGARDVPPQLGLEIPNPVPSQEVLSLGTPASITVAETKTIVALSFVITNSTTGAAVPVRILTNANDPNFLVPESFIAAIPLTVLARNATYRVDFSGSALERALGVMETINRTWSFTTGPQ
jgi:uncharacterized protein YkwD